MYTSNMTYIRHDLYICELEGTKSPMSYAVSINISSLAMGFSNPKCMIGDTIPMYVLSTSTVYRRPRITD
jgi:hypothetical protein